MNTRVKPPDSLFSSYEKFVVAVLAFLQFTIVLDFMILSPLGAILLPELNITTAQFGLVVSAYAFSAGASGLMAAGFADRYDRKKMLLFFYTGFVIGTLFCGLAPNYHFLLAARVVTGLFGGVIGSISFAIVTDIFPFQKRGRVMGIIQTAFAGSQIMGIPLGLYLANRMSWHAPFIFIVLVSIVVGIVIFRYLKPINDHLQTRVDRKALHHLWATLTDSRYLQGFASSSMVAIGGYMLMPFGSAFSVHNLGISLAQLPMVYMVTGIFSMILGPMAGRLSDRIGKFPVFTGGTLLMVATTLYYTRLGITPIWVVIMVSIAMFAGVSARMISSSALLSALPDAQDRGSFMAISASIQQVAGGLAAAIAGMIVVQNGDGPLGRFDVLGDVVVVMGLLGIALLWWINRTISRRIAMTS